MRIRREDITAQFGIKLYDIAANRGIEGAPAIAKALYENDECYKILKPGGRDTKYHVNKSKDIGTLSKQVQRHFGCERAYEVSSSYLYAYSKIFNCSIDYLFGLISQDCPNAEVNDITEKTGLSPKAVENLTKNKTIYLEEFLSSIDEYGLLDLSTYNNYDSDDDEDGYLDTECQLSCFWSKILESSLFDSMPENWYRMACAQYSSKAINVVAEDAYKDMDRLPSLEEFKYWVNNWNTFHADAWLCDPSDMSIEKVYKEDPEFVKQVYHEIRYDHYYSATDKKDEFEIAYWGCAGKFDRSTLNYFHEWAEEWCNHGPLPNIWDGKENKFSINGY